MFVLLLGGALGQKGLINSSMVVVSLFSIVSGQGVFCCFSFSASLQGFQRMSIQGLPQALEGCPSFGLCNFFHFFIRRLLSLLGCTSLVLSNKSFISFKKSQYSKQNKEEYEQKWIKRNTCIALNKGRKQENMRESDKRITGDPICSLLVIERHFQNFFLSLWEGMENTTYGS